MNSTFASSFASSPSASPIASTGRIGDARPHWQGATAIGQMVAPEQSDLFTGFLRSLICAIDAKDNYTGGHSTRVARISVCLAKQLGLCRVEQNTIYLAGLLHDIGKIGIDDRVLRKPGRLTTEELEHIKQHPQLGYDILESVKELDVVLPIVLHHHEAWDGSGYPHRLKGTKIPLLARIVAVADAFDAMFSTRPYRKGLGAQQIDDILRKGAGSQWDPQVVDAHFAVREEIRREVAASGVAMSGPHGKHGMYGPRNS